MPTNLDKTDIEKLKSLVSEEKEVPKKILPSVKERKYPIPQPQRTQRIEKENKKKNKFVAKQRQTINDGNKESSTFVKIDEHIVIANDLIDSKNDIKQIAATIALLSKAEKIRTEAIIKLENALNKLTIKLNDVKNKMSVEGYSLIEEDAYNMKDISAEFDKDSSFPNQIGNLHDELENLKKELKEMH